jgi:predicted  nucleic acid-binding Zn-ribbon protein
MTNQPRPESRISSLELRASTIEAKIIEMAADTAEDFKALRQDIKGLNDGMKLSFDGIGDAFTLLDSNIEAVKEDLGKLRDEVKSEMTAMEGRINGNIASMETHLVDTITKLWQQRPSGNQEPQL